VIKPAVTDVMQVMNSIKIIKNGGRIFRFLYAYPQCILAKPLLLEQKKLKIRTEKAAYEGAVTG
jgi:hypothetical protein